MGKPVRTDWFLNFVLGILVLCALVVTSLAIRREFFPDPPSAAASAATQPEFVSDWRTFAEHGHRAGPADAPVTIVEFADFQCPFCGLLAERLDSLREKYPDGVSVVYRHFPLDIHPHAVEAVRASECAAAQDRFRAYHNALFAAQDSIGAVPWERFAEIAEVADTSAFRRCVTQTGKMPALERDTLAAERLGVVATPTLLVNGMRFRGAIPMDTLEAYVENALRESEAKW